MYYMARPSAFRCNYSETVLESPNISFERPLLRIPSWNAETFASTRVARYPSMTGLYKTTFEFPEPKRELQWIFVDKSFVLLATSKYVNG